MKTSAGLLVYRWNDEKVEVLIVHPGGPYFAKKDAGVWGIPKGEIDEGENPVETAKREFEEELGLPAPEGELLELGQTKYPKNSKIISAWAVNSNIDLSRADKKKIAKFHIEWPPRSGQNREFPEIDKAEWHSMESAAKKMFKPQVVFLQRLAEGLGIGFLEPESEEKQLGLL